MPSTKSQQVATNAVDLGASTPLSAKDDAAHDAALSQHWDKKRADFILWVEELVDRRIAERTGRLEERVEKLEAKKSA